MIADLKPYSTMKGSSVPWLGKVPEHWSVHRGKWVFVHRKQVNVGGSVANVLSLTLRGVVNNNPDDPEGLVPKDYSTYQLFKKGDLVFKLIDLENLRTSRVGLVPEDGIMSSAYVRLVPRAALNIRFFFTQYFDLYQRRIYNQLGAGVRSTLGPSDLLNQPILIPPMVEQAAIVRFLDCADRRIQRYVRAKQKLIKLLEEQKQAIVHQAVTRGLDPNVRLRPSGVEWLGDVPEHWEVVPARYLFRAVNRRDVRGNETKLSVTQRHGLVPTDQMDERSKQASSFERFQVCEPRDLVVNKYKAHLGVFWAASMRGLITPNYTVFRPLRKLATSYFELLFHTRTYKSAFSMTVYGVTEGMSPLYTKDFYSIPVCMPPHSEQERIVSLVAERTRKEDNAISRVQQEIHFLREYGTRLMTDVVTGKLDVREAAAQLPDELEVLDEGAFDDSEPEDASEDDLDSVLEEAEA